jgi:hypothetical protein
LRSIVLCYQYLADPLFRYLVCLEDFAQIRYLGGIHMPAPIPDLSRDQQCHHYQTPTGVRCGSPAMKNEYYCYFHNCKRQNRKRTPFPSGD